MSAETVKTIIGRAVAEPEFRGLLFRDPPAVLAGYDLADAERAALTGLTPENFDALAGELEARVSRATISLEPEPDGGVNGRAFFFYLLRNQAMPLQ